MITWCWRKMGTTFINRFINDARSISPRLLRCAADLALVDTDPELIQTRDYL